MNKSSHVASLEDNLLGIDQIIEVPIKVRDIVIEHLNNFDISKMNHTDRQSFKNLISLIKNIDIANIRKGYSIIYNDVCVLAVSALSAELEKYFIDYINSNLHKLSKVASENLKEIKFSLDDTKRFNFNIKGRVGEFVLDFGRGISFQDLQSTLRSFEKFCNKKYNPRADIKDAVVFYHQCRHSIVHKNSVVDVDFLTKVKGSNLRDYRLGEKIELEQEDWNIMRTQFVRLLEGLVRV